MPVQQVIQRPDGEPIRGLAKVWTDYVEESALEQIQNVISLPFIHKHVAIMPDVHMGYGATVGSVIPTKGAIIPAAVGVDIGCGMMATQLSVSAADLPDSLADMRSDIERAVPHGFETIQGRSVKGAWEVEPQAVCSRWKTLSYGMATLAVKFPKLVERYPQKALSQLGTLGGGNHFIEVCLDEDDTVWVMLHSGSCSVGTGVK